MPRAAHLALLRAPAARSAQQGQILPHAGCPALPRAGLPATREEGPSSWTDPLHNWCPRQESNLRPLVPETNDDGYSGGVDP